MPSIFTQIINGEIPSYTIDEDEHCYAFLDINPNALWATMCRITISCHIKVSS